ncbi:MAG TPA: hemolysin family protein [Thermoanaerobaculia bacterium]|nr:hemolysin family protein [Thermoanaerobaculia bacterium]
MTTFNLFLAFLFVLANAFFVAAEFAIIKIRPTQLAALIESGSSRARMARRLTRSLDKYLSACQIGITFASLALGWVGERAFADLLLPLFAKFGFIGTAAAHSISATISLFVIATAHIIIGEQAPKYYAIQRPLPTALWLAHALRAFYVLAFPVIWLLNNITNWVLKLIGVDVTEEHTIHSEEEIRLILASSERAGVLSEENREIIEGVFQFSKRTARQIMVPRTDVTILSTTNSIEQNLEIIRTTRHTRYPLCDGDLDRTVGLIHVKDLFLGQLRGPGRTMNDLKREPLFIPENTTVEGVLSQFLEHRTHMAVILDEYGGASGIVSLENITEELFGQIQDEFDRERLEVEPLGNGRYRVRGDYLIEDLADRLKVDLGDPDEETIGGYVAARLGRQPSAGDLCEIGYLTLEVVEAERYRVRWLLVTVPEGRLAEIAARAESNH